MRVLGQFPKNLICLFGILQPVKWVVRGPRRRKRRVKHRTTDKTKRPSPKTMKR